MRVLFTGGGGAGSEAIWRLLKDRYDVHFADADPLAFAAPIPVDRRHQIPFAAAKEFPAALASLCKRLGIDVLAPGVDEELPRIPATVKSLVLMPQRDYVQIMLDKLAMARALAENGVDAPRTVTLDRAAEIGFPCIVKPRHGRGSRNVQVVAGAEQLRAYLTLNGGSAEDYVAQELLGGQEYTVLVAADRAGELRAVVPIRVDVKRGITIRAETEKEPSVIGYCKALHAAIPTTGPYNVQLMLDGGRARAFEINPRISTTFCLVLAAGVDPITLYADAAPSGALAPFRTGVKLRRYWTNDIA